MFNIILNLIFPPKCIFCNKILKINSEYDSCYECYNNIPFITNSNDRENKEIYTGGQHYDTLICVSDYSGNIKDALIRYKFFNRPSYSKTFANLLIEKIKSSNILNEIDLIISVPLYYKKMVTRGYNQSFLISEQLSKKLCIKECSNALKRIKETRTQSLIKNKNERFINVKDVFVVVDKSYISNKTILLVDDVFTTGYTLNECSKVLKENTAKKVICAVIASGRKY